MLLLRRFSGSRKKDFDASEARFRASGVPFADTPQLQETRRAPRCKDHGGCDEVRRHAADPSSNEPASSLPSLTRKLPPFNCAPPPLRRDDHGRPSTHGPELAVPTQQTRGQTAPTGQAQEFYTNIFSARRRAHVARTPSGAEHRTEPNHPQQAEEVTTAGPTPNRFWRMMTNPGFPSPASNPTLFVGTAEAFLGLTNQGEIGESSKGGSPFTPEIQDKPLPANFRLPALELYDGSCDPTEHIATFRAQMALYDTSDALMCRAFPTTLRGPARTWYCRLKLASISSFDLLTKEFELNFLASARPKPTTASLLGLAQGSDESLSQFVGRFTSQVQGIPDVHPSLAIQAFLMGLKPSRFFWSLIERPPTTVPEMLQRAHQYIAAETLVAGKRDESKHPRAEQPRGHPSGLPKRREDRSGMLPSRPPLIPLNSTRTEIFFQIREKGLLKAPNPMKTHSERRDKRTYCRFHREYDHDTEECRDLRYQIEDLLRHGHLRRYVRDQSSLLDSRPPRDPSPRPKGPVEKQIDVIIGEPASGDNSSSANKAYARTEVGKRPAHDEDIDITFRSGSEDSRPEQESARSGVTQENPDNAI
ncbi:hypothetical protein B296_00001264 [Ensete ventricosum]|uniref:Retrotransposon gag domain-containing protein n=1 Tax=Ensete ventricosum TaxID=4639 RepID=A0A427AQ32_ENSVE|nr:hypothetical protein B296_00001264 [Ensete ventricosum]